MKNTAQTQNLPYFSVVVPVFNEEGNAGPLFDEIYSELTNLGKPFEIIFVDDCSTDNTYDELLKKSLITIIRLRVNAGQSCALDAGIKASKGEVLITMDGDGQDDPANIPNLLTKLEEGFDVVCAWRQKRQDTIFKRSISSGWKYLRRHLVDDVVHDSGTQFRVYKHEVFDGVDLYGELHRFIPALLKWRGFKIGEVKVNHRPRLHGQTKYSWTKIFKGFSDMIYMWFQFKYATRPVHLFGFIGTISMLTGLLILFTMFIAKIFYGYPLSDKIWPLVGFFFVMIGLQMFSSGIIAANMLQIDTRKKYFIDSITRN